MPGHDQEARIAALEKKVMTLMGYPQRRGDAVSKSISKPTLGQSQVADAARTGTRGMDVDVIFEIGESFDDEGQPLFTTSGPVSMRVDYLRLLLDQYSAMSSITRR